MTNTHAPTSGSLRSFSRRLDPAALVYELMAFFSLEISQTRFSSVESGLAAIPEVIRDVDQLAIAAGLGATIFTVTRDAADAVTGQAVEYALTRRTASVLAIPYDIAALDAADEGLPEPSHPG